MQPHQNGVFDVSWSADDRSLATCSGDQSTRITDIETGALTNFLKGHTSTVKCMAWDQTNQSLLATGGRDGAMCLWDLRISETHKSEDAEFQVSAPVITIPRAHEGTSGKRRGKQNPAPRTVTNLLYPEGHSYGLISSSSFDGYVSNFLKKELHLTLTCRVLRYWDLRASTSSKTRAKTAKPTIISELYSSSVDPTTLYGSGRPRGIVSLASGLGPSAGVIFAMGADSRIHTYDLQTLTPQSISFHHENLQTNSFYVGVSISPCGRWLVCGGSGTQGSSFVFNVENAARPWLSMQPGFELKGERGEAGAVDWTRDTLAACTDDGTVRIWRQDVSVYRRCLEDPEQAKWDYSWVV